ncbi:MAG: DUF4340 domain-containing protein [Acidobacteriia bacterium]|nr:DUF4340 domain-containing protein [Terriglobia bacterium]
MRIGRLIALAFVVVGLGTYILLYERHKPTTDELKEQADKLFVGFDQAKAKKVVVTNPHGTFELVKDKDTWRLKAPLADQANQGAVSSLLFSMSGVKAERAFKAAEAKLSDFGLDKPPLRVTVEDDAGTAYTLKLGSELPLGNQRAAMTTGEKVYLVSKYVASDLEKDLAGWRSDELAQVYAGDVASVTVASASGQLVLAHAGTVWTISAPAADLADRERADGLIGDLSGARIKEFVDTAPDLKALGLEPRRFGVTIVKRDAKAAPIALDFGNERDAKDGKQVACKRGERVFWVDGKTVSRLGVPWQEWRSNQLVSFDSWTVDKLEIEAGASKAALERKDGIWKAGATEVDADAVSRRLNTLSDLKVRAFDQPKPSGAPQGRLKLSGEGGVSVETAFYAGTPDALAVVAGRTGALAVDAAQVREVLTDPASLAKPKLVPTPTAKPATTTPAKK